MTPRGHQRRHASYSAERPNARSSKSLGFEKRVTPFARPEWRSESTCNATATMPA